MFVSPTYANINDKSEHFTKFSTTQYYIIALMFYQKFARLLEIINKNIDLLKDEQMTGYCDEIRIAYKDGQEAQNFKKDLLLAGIQQLIGVAILVFLATLNQIKNPERFGDFLYISRLVFIVAAFFLDAPWRHTFCHFHITMTTGL